MADERVPFGERLALAIRSRGNPVLVGLDPRAAQLPAGLLEAGRDDEPPAIAEAYSRFCRGVIDVVAPLVAAVKPQMAFFEQLGPPGVQALADTIAHARQRDLLVILDGKRNDIASTATAYAETYLGSAAHGACAADALTVSPYLGEDSLLPFLEVAQARQAGVFILVKTSNPGSGFLQDLLVEQQPVYEHVAAYVERQAHSTMGKAGYGSAGAVVGATYPEQLVRLRSLMPHVWMLIPGYGAQGGTAQDVLPALAADGLGALVNSSRAIIFAHARPEYQRYGAQRWQAAVEAATRDMIAELTGR